jgi:hypothetical protein
MVMPFFAINAPYFQIRYRAELGRHSLVEPPARFRQGLAASGRVALGERSESCDASFQQSIRGFGGLHHAAALLRSRARRLRLNDFAGHIANGKCPTGNLSWDFRRKNLEKTTKENEDGGPGRA